MLHLGPASGPSYENIAKEWLRVPEFQRAWQIPR